MKIVIKRATREDRAAYEDARRRFLLLREDTLSSAGTIHSGNAEAISRRLRRREIMLAEELVGALSSVREGLPETVFPVCQSGETCVPMSVSNALLRLDASGYYGEERADQIAATNHLIDHFLAVEPGIDRSERRSLDRVKHYFSNKLHREIGLPEGYRFTLTGSLIDAVFRLYSEDGCVLSAFQGHCVLFYGLRIQQSVPVVDLKDPLVARAKVLALDEFADRYLWSPLGGLPYAASLGQSYSAPEALKLIEDQAERGNTGVCCPSGILERVG